MRIKDKIYFKMTLLVIMLLLNVSGLKVALGGLEASANTDSLLFNKQYYQLTKQLSVYKLFSANKGWDSIIWNNDTLVLNKITATAGILRKRLQAEGYLLKRKNLTLDDCSEQLINALRLFQLNNGVKETGNINKQTITALNITVTEKEEQIKDNMEHWKTLPADLGKQYVFVNVADFSMKVINEEVEVMKMKIIAGQTFRRTPMFKAQLSYLIFNPTWNIPPTILKKDVIPVILKDVSYLAKKHIRIYKSDKQGVLSEVSADSVNWKKISASYFPYQLIQDAGSTNPLGKVKFMFPNEYDVYMHDTPSKGLFEKEEPTFSSGCIRLERAIDLADYLLNGYKEWSPKEIENAIKIGETITVRLQKQIPVYIQYFTSWVGENGMIQFRKDIYNQEKTTY